ncbi:hypothetical protein RI367_001562 [Sorochytrium milnesiophthora]
MVIMRVFCLPQISSSVIIGVRATAFRVCPGVRLPCLLVRMPLSSKSSSSASSSERAVKRQKVAGSSPDLAPRVANVTENAETDAMDTVEDGDELMASVHASHPSQDSGRWQSTINRVVKSIVSIRFAQVAAFDTDGADTSEATGFIVDAEAGIVLTNRHVVGAGPFVGTMVCHDHEEVDVQPIYRDPVHDFGFLRFDPKQIMYMGVAAIPLRPDLAQIGLEIRVCGNDAGEKLSILAGSISRLDRNAPDYGDLTYNDFNTFYLQAASSTSGGSSGSPVIDINGNCVALQAGGHTKAATDFFFPLDRIVRALSYLKRSEPVPRGTIMTQWLHRPYDEVKRLGLPSGTQSLIRQMFPDEIGMLVAEAVVPEGVAHEVIEEGDILLKVNGQHVTKFVPLEAALDDAIGQDVTLELYRGSTHVEVTIPVIDLHAITPSQYVEIGGSKLNNLSYQLARLYGVPCKGVYVADPVGMFRLDGNGHGWIIDEIDNQPTPNLDELVRILRELPDRERVPVVYYNIADLHIKSVGILNVERHWTKFRRATRNDQTGLWDFEDFGSPKPPTPLKSLTAAAPHYGASLGPTTELMKSLVKVSVYMPVRLDGQPKSFRHGSGVILDTAKGLVVVSGSVVPTNLADVYLTFYESVIIPAEVVFIHPTHNFTFLKYDPALIGQTPVASAPISDTAVEQGMTVEFLAFNHNQRPVHVTTTVTDITPIFIPCSTEPRSRAINFNAISLDTPLCSSCGSGVIADQAGRLQGLWLMFAGERTDDRRNMEYNMGIHISAILPVLEALKANEQPQLYCLNMEMMPISIVQGRFMGVTEEWIDKVNAAAAGNRPQLLTVRRIEAGLECDGLFKDNDLLLEVNGRVITKLSDMDVMYHERQLELVIVRAKKVKRVTVQTSPMDTSGTRRFVVWAGALIQEPHKAVRQQSKRIHSGCYISGRSRGSPSMYGMAPTQWVTHINDQPTPNLDALIAAVRDGKTGEYVRVKLLSFDNVPSVISIKINNHYFPAMEMRQDKSVPTGWRAFSINGNGSLDAEMDLE